MQSIRLLETQAPPPVSRQLSSPSPATSTPSSKKYEPWNDIQLSFDGGISSSNSNGITGISGGTSDTAAIAPWMTDDGADTTQSPPPSKRTLFSSSKVSLSKGSSLTPHQHTGSFLSRARVGSEASSYQLAANGVNGTPFNVSSEFGEAWGIGTSSTPGYLSRTGSVDPGSTPSLEHKDGKKSLRDRGKDLGRLLKKKASKVGLGKSEGSDEGHAVHAIPPLPYPNSSSTNLSNGANSYGFPSSSSYPHPPHSPTAPKEKKRKGLIKIKHRDKDRDHDAFGTHSNEYPGPDPEITLDTDLDRMEGIIDLNKGIRSLHEIKGGPNFASNVTAGTITSTSNTDGSFMNWDDHGGSSSFGTSDGGGGTGGLLSHVGTPFTDPWAAGPSTAGSSTATGLSLESGKRTVDGHSRNLSGGSSPLSGVLLGKRKSHPPTPLLLGSPSPKGTRSHAPAPSYSQPGVDASKDPAWHAPESWDVDKVGPEAQDYSSGDEEMGGNKSNDHATSSNAPAEDDFGIIDSSLQQIIPSKARSKGNVHVGVNMIGGLGGGAYGINMGYGKPRNKSDAYAFLSGALPGTGLGFGGAPVAVAAATQRKDSWPDEDAISRRPSDALSSSTAPKTPMPSFHLRVYRIDGTYHIVECPVNTSASDLSHVLRKKLLLPGQHYKLHLRERGRERVLGTQERPINILRRRLEQAGYDDSDDLERLGGDDLGFLLRFVFRDANLTAAQASEEDDVFGTSATLEHIDLTGRGLLTIPIALHRHAPTIVVLNLSKNPHIDIPLDFIAACPVLRDLRLSHAAMKQVPSRVKHISTLHELDISCNRMVTLDEADLHRIPGLRNVQVQNNRLATLPSSFSEMKALKFLNISNNKFDTIPTVLWRITSLVELDLSFNTVGVFPPELGKLVNLERLVIMGNRIGALPAEIADMVHLKELDIRRNAITDISPLFQCPSLEVLRAESNLLHGVELAAGSKIKRLCVSGNERLSSFTVQALTDGEPPYALQELDVSKCMLSSLGDSTLSHLKNLDKLKFDHNTIRAIPDAVCQLSQLRHLSGSNNHLTTLPAAIGQLTKLKSLHVHNNNIKAIPASIWQCQALVDFNASSNLIASWEDPVEDCTPEEAERRRPGTALSGSGRPTPPLASCLQRLYLADNRLDDDIFHSLAILRTLLVLNLSFNDIYELPPLRLQTFAHVRELYLSGNKLTSLPGEDLHRLSHLRVLFLNANKLQTLPAELTKVKTLECLDVGNNVLKYNIANWQFDWNWNFNRELRYLNLSGNKRLEIKNTVPHDTTRAGRAPLTDFSELKHLRLLGLMDVTLSVNPAVPDESEERRVRTSPSDVNNMAYGVADTLGMVDTMDKPNNLNLSMFDLVIPSFRGRDNECLFGMFGRHVPVQSGNRPTSNRLTRYLHNHFTRTFQDALKNLRPDHGETIPDALRRAFLALNKGYYESLKPPEGTTTRKGSIIPSSSSSNQNDLKNAASGLVLYIVDEPDQRMMYVANVGNILAVVSRKQANPVQVSTNHDPFDRNEIARIRTAEGWVSPKGTVNDELEISRSFGVYHLLPAVNARPDVATVPLTDQDEFVIIGNRGLWDYVSPQTAVDIARLNKNDPMIAAQRLRDYAMSYGAQGSTMIMVIAVGDLFHPRLRHSATDVVDMDLKARAPRKVETIGDRTLARLESEIPPPTGHLALVFTDIRNSTSLWEKNPGMPTAMKLHNSLLRRQLRQVGGYEVKTEGDAFMVSFQSVAAALLWSFNVQILLMQEEWPLWILESQDGGEIVDNDGSLLARGLSVRMGIHWGAPNCEPDPVTGRMDYFGTVVNRASRISASAKGGQIMVSKDVVKEIMTMIPMDDSTQGFMTNVEGAPLEAESGIAVEALHRMGIHVKEVGEARLKGIEVPETLSLVYPKELVGRFKLDTDDSSEAAAAAPRMQFNVDQIRSLAMLAIRVEALASGRVFRDSSMLFRNYSIQSAHGTPMTPDDANQALFMHANPELLMPTIRDNATDADLAQVMESLSLRIENAVASIYLNHVGGYHSVLSALEQATKVDTGMLVQALAMFSSLMQ